MGKAIHIRRTDAEPLAFGELRIWAYKTSEALSSSLALIQVRPGATHSRARSTESDKYYYVLSGLLEFQVGEIEYWLTEGDLLVVPRGEWFNYRNGSDEPAALVLFHTPPFRPDAEEFADEE